MFVPGNAMVVVVGDANQENHFERNRRNFRHWKQEALKKQNFPDAAREPETSITIVDQSRFPAQSNIDASNPAIGRTNP